MAFIKHTMGALFAIIALGAVIASSATAAVHPLFLTESKKTLLFLGEGNKPVLHGLRAGLAATVECEKVLIHGLILHESSLVHLSPILFEGKCVQKINGGENEACAEHITTKPVLAELGLLKSGSKTVVILLAPGDGTATFVNLVCGGNTTTVGGTLVGEIPEINSNFENQYDKEVEELEVIFATNPAGSDQQKITTIFLLGSEMEKQELKVEGFLGEKAAEEATVILKPDGKVKIDVGSSAPPPTGHPLFLTASKLTLLFSGEGSKPVLRGEVATIASTIECEHVLIHGLILNNSTLAHLLPLIFHGKCNLTIGGEKAACVEPIVTKGVLAELGLVSATNHKAAMLLSPSDGTTTFAEPECGGRVTTVGGTIVSEIPEENASHENQYNTAREELEVLFATASKNNQQAITTINLLETEMTGQELKVSGLFGGKAAWEMTWNLKADGLVTIDATSSAVPPAGHPLFLTASKLTLLFSGEGSKPVLRSEQAGLPATIECEHVLIHGLILNNSTLAHLLPLIFHGKCAQKVNGGANEACSEPIVTKKILAELGLISSTTKTVAILMAPGDGTITFFKLTCGGHETTVGGTIVGEIPEHDALGENQYDVEREELEVIFATVSKNNQQKITEILLLGTQMTKQELKIEGFLGGKCSWEMTWNLKADGKIKLDV